MKTNPLFLVPALALALLSACAPTPPAVVVNQPAAPVAPAQVVVEDQIPEPPPLQTEVVVASPGPDYLWIGGNWSWQGGSRGYGWTAGRWERPPHAGAKWAPAHTEPHGGGKVFVEGKWH